MWFSMSARASGSYTAPKPGSDSEACHFGKRAVAAGVKAHGESQGWLTRLDAWRSEAGLQGVLAPKRANNERSASGVPLAKLEATASGAKLDGELLVRGAPGTLHRGRRRFMQLFTRVPLGCCMQAACPQRRDYRFQGLFVTTRREDAGLCVRQSREEVVEDGGLRTGRRKCVLTSGVRTLVQPPGTASDERRALLSRRDQCDDSRGRHDCRDISCRHW